MIEQIQRDATTAYFAVDYGLRIAPQNSLHQFWSEIVRYVIFAVNFNAIRGTGLDHTRA